MKPVYAVMVPRLPGHGYVVSDPLFEDKAEADMEAGRLTEMVRKHSPTLPACCVKVFALTPKVVED